MVFTVVGVATNVYVAFAIQLLFVLFNPFQGFLLFLYFVLISRVAREALKELVLARYQAKVMTHYSAKHVHSLPSTDKNSKVTYEKAVNTASAQTNDESMFVDDGTLVVDDNVETDAQLPSLFNANENTFENQKSTISNTSEMHRKEEHIMVNRLS